MLGQPTSMLIPPVVGLRLSGAPREALTATDVVLTITELFASTVSSASSSRPTDPAWRPLSARDAGHTIGNMSPEYGATCAIFPIDQLTVDYSPSPDARKNSSTWSRRTPRCRASGTITRPRSRSTPRP